MSEKFVYVKCVEGKPVPHFGAGGGKIRFIGCKLEDNSWTFYPDKPVRIALESWIRSKKSYDRALKNGHLVLSDEKEFDAYHNPPAPEEEPGAEIIKEEKSEKKEETKADEPQKIEEKPEETKPAKKRRVKK